MLPTEKSSSMAADEIIFDDCNVPTEKMSSMVADIMAALDCVENASSMKMRLFVLPNPSMNAVKITIATEYVVGDESGWTIKFNYQAWAKDKQLLVGDKLVYFDNAVFKYPIGVHNVFRVNETGFKECSVPPANEALSTGNDEITHLLPLAIIGTSVVSRSTASLEARSSPSPCHRSAPPHHLAMRLMGSFYLDTVYN
ncbi:hypothetical protein HHK36_011552 [Tetracentron sinense]|uniref:Phytocyanin domain-containing protein n=1 Tax=Tetracentron sinense TaxID=13715 RepID=A0A834ZDW8_TETSI|nr:hypothetical protein HHK36_011552 [Tetracentron sinense]